MKTKSQIIELNPLALTRNTPEGKKKSEFSFNFSNSEFSLTIAHFLLFTLPSVSGGSSSVVCSERARIVQTKFC